MNSSTPTTTGPQIENSGLPRHVAVIMDGNGRWATKRLLNRIKGHEKGAESVRTVVRVCREIGIPILTLYAFSTENWRRPKSEVAALMSLLKKFLVSEQKQMMENEIRLDAIGQLEMLPEEVSKTLQDTIDLTRNNQGLHVNLALSYGSRAEIVRMARKIAEKVLRGQLDLEDIDEAAVSNNLYTKDLPDPDLLIRTSGEMRISNFLLWQIAYAEIFVTPTLWPDFGEDEFLHIIRDFQGRERRFGRV